MKQLLVILFLIIAISDIILTFFLVSQTIKKLEDYKILIIISQTFTNIQTLNLILFQTTGKTVRKIRLANGLVNKTKSKLL